MYTSLLFSGGTEYFVSGELDRLEQKCLAKGRKRGIPIRPTDPEELLKHAAHYLRWCIKLYQDEQLTFRVGYFDDNDDSK